jgi:acetyl esterase/lipase
VELEPGGPPSRRARVGGRVIRALIRTIWEYGPPGTAGMRFLRRATSLIRTPAPRGVRFERDDFGAFTGEWVRAGSTDESRVFLYFHGGGYFFGSAALYRRLTWRLSAATHRPVLAIDYRLAPEHAPADALEDALTAYEGLLSQGYPGSAIVVGGDSAGGHLTLALLLALKERGRPLPAAAVAISPWADLGCEAESHVLNARTDAMIPARRLAWSGRYYCQGRDSDDPLYAPVRGDYAGLPPLMLISSGSEILRDDSRTVAARAAAAGIRVVHQEWDGQVHVFPLFADFIPEGRAVYRHIREFLRSVLAPADSTLGSSSS